MKRALTSRHGLAKVVDTRQVRRAVLVMQDVCAGQQGQSTGPKQSALRRRFRVGAWALGLWLLSLRRVGWDVVERACAAADGGKDHAQA